MQAYDSVAVEADVELGGTDQLYNLLTGRDVMEAYGLEPQVVLTTPLIDSWDGTKMSGSKGNYLALVEDPNEQFGKTMRLPDELLETYYRLVMERELPSGDPMQAKLALARFIVERHTGLRPRPPPRSISRGWCGRERRLRTSPRRRCRPGTRSICPRYWSSISA